MHNKNKNFQIYLKGENKTNSVLHYTKIGYKYRITFTDGKCFTYNSSNVRIIESALANPKSKDCFDYLKTIANAIGLKGKNNRGETTNLLANSYSNIKFIMPDSMLADFLSGQLQEVSTKENHLNLINDKIYPFGFNSSQKEAIDKALSNRLSIIEGPPGTGKTQTILNIIANALMRGESVAVVSSNNAATKNVLDKLKKYDVDFIGAYLGNMENKQDFINSQKPLPDMINWYINYETLIKLRQELNFRYAELKNKLEQQNKLAILKQNLSEVLTEEKHFLQYYKTFEVKMDPEYIKKAKYAEKVLNLALFCETYEETKYGSFVVELFSNLIEYLKFWDRRKLTINKLLKQNYSLNHISALLHHKFYELKINEFNKEISKLEKDLTSFNFNTKMIQYSKLSAKLFKAKLVEKYSKIERKKYELDDLWRKSSEFIRDYPLILSTTYSLRNSLSNNVMYDYVIVDEASQVDLCTGALALSCAKKAIIVGDLKQLPNVVDSSTARVTDEIFNNYGLRSEYQYKNHCLLSAITKMFPNAPSTLLKEHYRCHSKIIEFCNKKFYNNQLIVLSDINSQREPLLLYKTKKGNHARDNTNQRQIDVIKEEIIPQQQISLTDGSLGIVTPYRNQTNALQQAFKGTTVKADTVDKFQGRENKIIILSTVDNEITDFTDNSNRLNVAVSRAIEQLIVIINESDFKKDTNINELVRYIEYNNLSVIDSNVFSVFDYLYKSYARQRALFLKKHKRISQYDSENLMYGMLTETLSSRYGSRFDVAVHIPLKMIIRDTSLMSNEEKTYATNDWTHVDFLLFNTIDKSPILAIEVDGAAFHKPDTKQAQRDLLKDSIFAKYEIPLLRFRTDGSNEQSRLIKVLDELNEKNATKAKL